MNPQLLMLLAPFIEASDSEDVNADTRLKDDLGLDSMDLVQLVMDLNRTFKIEIHSSEIIPAYFEDIGAVQDFIKRKQAQ